MQKDPRYEEMVRRSFIMRKYSDLEAPLVPKQPTIREISVATVFLSTVNHLLVYPFDTIKTRTIANNRIVDVARFTANKTNQATIYLGIARGYGSALVGCLCHLLIGRDNMALGCIAEGVLKTWIDMSKVSKQMANQSADLTIMRASFIPCILFGVTRDLIYRSVFFTSFTQLKPKETTIRPTKFNDQINALFASVLFSTLISQPFEVCFGKMASQRSLRYVNLWQVPVQIAKEQGVGKLLASGLWPRIVYNLLSTLIMFNSFDRCVSTLIEVM